MIKYLSLILLISQAAVAQSVFGYWKTIDNEGIAKSIVKIYKTDNGKVEGKVHKILKASARDRRCTACQGDKKNKPIEGLVILEDMTKEVDKYANGQITDPENGKTYDCKIWLDDENSNILHVRGYIAFFYRTQDWQRTESGEF